MNRTAQSCRSFRHPQTPHRRREGPGRFCPPHHTTLRIMSVITHTVRLFITSVISTSDVCLQSAPHTWHGWFKPYDWALFWSHKHWTTRFVLTGYIKERWHLNVGAVELGHCGCMDRRRVNMVTQASLDLLLHSHATEFPYQNNTSKSCIWNK